MIRFAIPLLMSVMAALCVQAQEPAARSTTIAGRVVDDAGRPVPYANIGLLHRECGTVSSPQGDFRMTVDSLTALDTLRISCIGYNPRTLTGESLTRGGSLAVELSERVEEIADVVVMPEGEERLRTFGHAFRKSGITASFRRGQEGGEVGVVCRMKGRRGELREARITLLRSTGIDTLHLRLNCYAINGDEVGENLCRTPILLSVPAPKSRTTLTVDMQPYDIRAEGDILFSVENLTPMGAEGQLWFAAGLTGRCRSRYTSQSPWRDQFFGVGIQVDIITRE